MYTCLSVVCQSVCQKINHFLHTCTVQLHNFSSAINKIVIEICFYPSRCLFFFNFISDSQQPVPPVCEVSEVKLASQACSRESGSLASILGDVVFVREESGDRTQIKTDMERAKAEIENFKTEPLVPMSSDPLVWWKNNQWQFPLLSNLARK